MDDTRFAEWKVAAQAHADDLDVVGKDALWTEEDSYELKEAAREAFEMGEDPKTFIEEIFGDTIASNEHDEQQAAEALDAEDEDEDEVDDDVE